MNKSVATSRKIKNSLVIILVGIAAAFLYAILDGDINQPLRLLSAGLIGFFGSGFIALNEIWFNSPFIRQMKFINLIIYKSVLYSTFFVINIVLVATFIRSLEENTSLINYWQSEAFRDFFWNDDLAIMIIYALTATTSFILVYQISRKMGQGVLWNFITGKYHFPREEERIFMFMDLDNSTTIAETIGDINFNKLLNDFFYDITASIMIYNGEIYRYVGDEIVVTWKLKKGLPNANFIRTYFHAKKTIYDLREKYLNKYGLVPKFTAGFNFGKVIVGEIGEVKSQIVFIGDAMYGTAEIEKSCRRNNTQVLVSEALLEMTELPKIYLAKKAGLVEIPDLAAIKVMAVSEI